MGLIKALWYGMFINYHLGKKDKTHLKYKTIHRYHQEMAEHYYEKAYGETFDNENK